MSLISDEFRNPYGPIRSAAFKHWETQTGRICHSINDDVTGSLECKWQDRATFDCGYTHISIFCSLGDWASNISDLLKEESYDLYFFEDEEHSQSLYRTYTRFLLVASEIISDFEKIVQKANGWTPKRARKFLSKNNNVIDSLFEYINSVCKHKVLKIHRCNHHLPIWFQDSTHSTPFAKPISLSDVNLADPDSILVPSLIDLIDMVLLCYQRVDEIFGADHDKFLSICDEYDDSIEY